MASEIDTVVGCVGKNIPKTKRKLQQQLRSAGLAYVSRTGKIIPAKRVSDELCQCPQKCNDRISWEARERLFDYFYKILGDADSQNRFLRAHMDVKARSLPRPERPPAADQLPLPLGVCGEAPAATPAPKGARPPRRITCKYLMPLVPTADTVEICQKAFCSAFVISTKRVRLQREKLIHSMGLNSYHHQKYARRRPEPVEKTVNMEESSSITAVIQSYNHTQVPVLVEQNNPDTGMEVRVRRADSVTPPASSPLSSQPSGSGRVPVDNPLVPPGITVPDGVTIAPVYYSPDQDRDIAIVNNFFYNQLWKPEYIGTYS